ncbi:helix-turn-helix domain-containing protein [Vibrio sp. DW001]|uniref:phage repressor protein CI n=1 Tax=Vibrio sp. DW001 TaxID=2912315 RepID=UPI0023AF77DC|nr:phage repressor protein CI [Vibrio sp. DW001]WED29023.1 helix-turn-helix domain-containing protein [Vibrio sp. DW001]
MPNNTIPAFDYLSGVDFTENLKQLTKCKTLLEMSELLEMPKATFSTWNTHNRTSHELMVRLHLASGIPIEELALKPEQWHLAAEKKTPTLPSIEPESSTANEQLKTIILKSFCLTNGEMLPTGEIPYPSRRIRGFKLENADLVEIETNEGISLIDRNQTDPVSGNYLIRIDGRYSINQIQRLPGKLAISFDGSTIEVVDGDIEVVGKVVVGMRVG